MQSSSGHDHCGIRTSLKSGTDLVFVHRYPDYGAPYMEKEYRTKEAVRAVGMSGGETVVVVVPVRPAFGRRAAVETQ